MCDDYKNHNSCISEAEKYGGKDFTPSSSANKGQKKQDVWLDKVQKVLDNTKTNNPSLKDVLESLTHYPNVPQKKHKFINFLKNSFPRHRNNNSLLEEVWKVLEEAKADMTSSTSQPVGDNVVENNKIEESSADKDKKKKKRKEEDVLEEAEVEAIRAAKKQKRGLKSNPEHENVESLNDTLQETEKSAKDFNWEELITAVLGKKGEISLKKLRKKAVGEFVACGRFMKSEENVWKKLDKKLRSMDNVRVVNDKVSFRDS